VDKLRQNFRVIVPTLIGLRICGLGIAGCESFSHGLNVLVSDHTEFEYDHNLPRGYDSKTTGYLETLQGASIIYAQHHKGNLPPMQTSAVTLKALTQYLAHGSKYCANNPATKPPFTPSAKLSGRKMGVVSHDGRAILFYDSDPPANYRRSCYVAIKGVAGHVTASDLPKLLIASRQE